MALSAFAQEQPSLEVLPLHQVLTGQDQAGGTGDIDYDMRTGCASGTNGVCVRFSTTNNYVVLTSDRATVNTKTYDIQADGHVRIESGDQLWVGEHIQYNLKTRRMQSDQFRTGKAPVFAGGENLSGDNSQRIYTATNGYVTTDDYSNPTYRVRASRIKVVGGKSVEMWNAVAYADKVPFFYFPYFKRNLGARANNFTVTPGYRSRYGAYLLNTYTWYLGDATDGKVHVDYRERRGPGMGPDLNLHLDRWGDVTLKYYYQNDQRSNISTNSFPQFSGIPENRQRFYLGWQATPATNLNLKAQVNYQSDPLFLHDFFEGDYSANPQPNTFVEANQYWDNWSLDALTTPRVNSFFSQVERLPDVKLTGFSQQVFDTPVYYDSETSAGWYRSFVANTATNGTLFSASNGYYADSAARADTYHQFTLPWTFFNWLNVAPRVGGRLTYYSSRSDISGLEDHTYREVFNTGVGTSFKASQLWADATNSLLQVDGLRHIIEPSANYVFVPDPSTPPAQLPQFDGEIPSLMLLPVMFPDYNSIDSIDTQNAVRFGLRNVLQTKRGGELEDLLNWNMLMDWRLDPKANQSSLNDLYSQLVFRPRTWLMAESQLRYDLNGGNLNLSFHQLTFAPNNRWSWGIGHWYLRDGTWGNGTWIRNDFITSTVFFRVNDNWGLRATHDYNVENGRLQEQYYTIYRDLRSWTAAFTFRVTDEVNGSKDFTVAFALSLKASPSTAVGEDVVNRYRLVGE